MLDDDGCLLWRGAKDYDGYGHCKILKKQWMVHRFIYYCYLPTDEDREAFLQSGDLVIHLCDTPSCINFQHLRAATAHDNMHDMIDKGRAVRLNGTQLPQSKLTDDEIQIIRKKYDDGMSQGALARLYGTNQSTISRAINGLTWKHV